MKKRKKTSFKFAKNSELDVIAQKVSLSEVSVREMNYLSSLLISKRFHPQSIDCITRNLISPSLLLSFQLKEHTLLQTK